MLQDCDDQVVDLKFYHPDHSWLEPLYLIKVTLIIYAVTGGRPKLSEWSFISRDGSELE